MNPKTIVGVEVGKTSVVCCCLDVGQVPSDYREFARSYTPQQLLPNLSGLQTLLELGDTYIIEPTGDYSKIWIDSLRANEKQVLRVNPKRVKALKEYHGVFSKTDRYDGAFLALYGAENLNNPTAFLSDYAEDLRELVLKRDFLGRMAGNHQRRLWQLLSREWPECCRNAQGKKPAQNRAFLNPEPGGLWRFIADEDYPRRILRERSYQASIGCGLSELSRTLATQICELERKQYGLELEIVELLKSPQFDRYHKILDLFGFGDVTRAAILNRIYPFERFLGPDGKPIRTKAPSKNNRLHRRDKSLNAFRLSLGNGTKVYQSGQLQLKKAAGPKYARTALYLHIRTRVVIQGGLTKGQSNLPKYLILYRKLYQDLPPMPINKAISKIQSKCVKDLYRELLSSL